MDCFIIIVKLIGLLFLLFAFGSLLGYMFGLDNYIKNRK